MMNREKKIIKASIIGIITNVFLVGFKMTVGLIAGSIAIVLDAVNNLTDILSSLVMVVGTKLAGRRPDREHPYGHGRYEYLCALVVGAIILATGIMALVESVPKIFHPELAEYSVAAIIIIAGAVLTKILLGSYVKRTGKILKSDGLIAAGTDALWDAVLSFATLVGIFVALWFKISIDGYLGVLIAVFILRSSLEILGQALENILGTSVDPEFAQQIKRCICQFKQVKGAYDLRLHNYGPNSLIGSVHIEVADTLTAQEIHYLTHEIAHKIYTEFGVTLTVAVYAENTSNHKYQEIRQQINQLVKQVPEISAMHGFFVDDRHKVIFFDLEVPFQYYHLADLGKKVVEQAKEVYPQYDYSVTLDLDMEA